jgi:hypothetical protein
MWTIVKYGLIALAVYGVAVFIYMIGQEKGKSWGDKTPTKEAFEDEAESNISSLKEARTKIDEVINALSKNTVEKMETDDEGDDQDEGDKKENTKEHLESEEDDEEEEEEDAKPKKKASAESKETFTNSRRQKTTRNQDRFMTYSGVQSPKFNNYMLL